MKFIANLIKNIIKLPSYNEKIALGRWNIDYCVNKINQKVDLSNEDHCGVCQEYRKSKTSWTEIDEFYF